MVDVCQSRMLITLPGDAVSGEITGTGLDFRVPLAEIFFRVHKRTKHSKVFFTVYCILIMSFNINFSFILETKSSSFLGLNGLSISYQRPLIMIIMSLIHSVFI